MTRQYSSRSYRSCVRGVPRSLGGTPLRSAPNSEQLGWEPIQIFIKIPTCLETSLRRASNSKQFGDEPPGFWVCSRWYTPWTIAYWTCSRTKSLLRIVSTSLNVLIKEIGIDRPRFTLLLQVTIGIDRQFPNLLTDQWAYSIGYCPGCGRYLVPH